MSEKTENKKGYYENNTTICPRCGKTYSDRPAISRTDNETLICPDCGIRESLESIGVKADGQEKILKTIKRFINGK